MLSQPQNSAKGFSFPCPKRVKKGEVKKKSFTLKEDLYNSPFLPTPLPYPFYYSLYLSDEYSLSTADL